MNRLALVANPCFAGEMMRPSTLLALGLVSLSPAATLFVLEGASSANQYSSIGAALAAASNGDTVAIKNRKGNLPWNENLLVSKNLVLTRVDGAEDWQLNGYINVKNTPKAVIVDLVQTGTVADTLSQVDSVFWINSSLTGLVGQTAPTSGAYVGVFSSSITSDLNLVPTSGTYSATVVNSKVGGNLSMANAQILGASVIGQVTLVNGGRPEITRIMGSDLGNLILRGSSLTYQVRNNKISSGIYVYDQANDANVFAHNESVYDFTSNAQSGTSQVYHNFMRSISGNSSNLVEAFYNSGPISTTTNSTLGSIRMLNNEAGCYNENIYYCTKSNSSTTISRAWDSYCNGEIKNTTHWCTTPKVGADVGFGYRLTDASSGYYALDKQIYVINDSVSLNTVLVAGMPVSVSSVAPAISSVKLNFKNLANLSQGNPDPIYNNIDGSIASLGVAGGPTPYSNWSRAGRLSPSLTQARVYDLTLPSSVKTGEQIPVTIKAYDH